MALIRLPDELITEIGSYLFQPDLPQLSAEPFTEWKDIIHTHGSASRRQAKNYYALAASSRRLRSVLSTHPTHAYGSFNATKLRSALLLRKASSLSILDLLEMEEDMGVINESLESGGPLNLKSLKVARLLPENSSIDTLYMMSGSAQGHTLHMLFAKFKMLRTLYFNYEGLQHSGQLSNYHKAELTFPVLATLVKMHFSGLEKLVITRGNAFENDDESIEAGIIGPEASLRHFPQLRSLSIGSFLLLGDGEQDNGRKRICKFLPASLEELEIMYDGQFNNTFITGSSATRPHWLFDMLRKKERYNSQLQRIRIISLLEWDTEQEDDEIWSRRYVQFPGDWAPENGAKNWKPPLELIIAFKQASVSFGVWLHRLRNYKMVVPGGTWFSEDWEETWSGKKYDIEEAADIVNYEEQADEEEEEDDEEAQMVAQMEEWERLDLERRLLADLEIEHHIDEMAATRGRGYAG